MIGTQWGHIILEVDESKSVFMRMKQIYFDIGEDHGKVIFIRYNPDNYSPSFRKEFNSFERLKSLLNWINKYIFDQPADYLFYDGYTQLTPEIDRIDPYDMASNSMILTPKTNSQNLSKIKLKRKISPVSELDQTNQPNSSPKIKLKPKLISALSL